MALLAFATADAVFVVARFAYDATLGVAAGGLVALAVLVLWVGLPEAR